MAIAADSHLVQSTGASTLARTAWRDRSIWPGICLSTIIAGAAFAVHGLPGFSIFSPLILAITIGVVFHNVIGMPARAQRGVSISVRTLLRLAIVLLGFQFTWQEMGMLGWSGVAIIATTLVTSFTVTTCLGRWLGVDAGLTRLIAAGTAICGASAIAAANTVTDAPEEDVVYAIACISIFGSLAMFIYPWMPSLLQLDSFAYGLWAGASIHEIAQVVAAGFAVGDDAGTYAVIAKLTRVMMLVPLLIILGAVAARQIRAGATRRSTNPPLPWFVLGFIAVSGINSFIDFPDAVNTTLATLTSFLMAISLAALGLQTDAVRLLAKGLRPFLLAAFSALFIAAFAFMLVKITF